MGTGDLTNGIEFECPLRSRPPVWLCHVWIDMSSATETTDPTAVSDAAKIPMIAKVGFTAFIAVLVAYYWIEYEPTNFVYFCDIALFLTLAAVGTEKPLLASLAAVGIVLSQVLWQVDFVGQLLGLPVTGMTDYMFNPEISLFGRGLSFFHFWLPILLIGLVLRLGYDRRAFWGWTSIAWVAILVSYFLLPEAGATLQSANQPHNVNYVFGMSSDSPQTLMPSWAWLSLLLVGLPALVYLPTHGLLWFAWSFRNNAIDNNGIENNPTPT